ncbi:hypothetical protein [Photorhabdus temperata]|uniref:hypothetical protein n=1 Tax=Photorhabdus temperata TaxID=574560 RepID=UPI002696DED3
MDKCQVIDIPIDTEKKTRMDQVQIKDPGAFSGRIGQKTQNVSASGVYSTLQAQPTLGA